MKKIILIFSLLIFVVCPVNASELIGQISTNPSELSGDEPDDSASPPANSGAGSGSDAIFINDIKQDNGDKEDAGDNKQDKEIKVLGISHGYYPDNALLRANDKKIYIIEGQVKKYIAGLDELIKYTGQTIYDVTDDELARYQERKHLNNDLIREHGRDEIYIIENAQKRHILSLEELRANYFGQEIFNISSVEMKLYSLK
ncbi:hypothetical protein KAR28_01100 [Candidatus Parcubacteria bacterium]|nr:hypothetical protein [Candidatus Parcubacteria bacterium]